MNSLSSQAVEADDVAACAQFVLLSKRGDAAAAAEFLRRTLAEVDGSGLDMAALSSTLGYDIIGADLRHFSEGNGGLQPIPFVGDEIDSHPATLVMLIPGDMHVVGHVIGKGGSEISKIEVESGASIKIEAQPTTMSNMQHTSNANGTSNPNGQQNERIVTVSGTVVSCVKAQRLLEKRLRARLESDGIHREVLRIIVPNDFVRHLIGKGGSNITQLQSQAGIRIQVQAEANMAPNQLGRAVTFQGAEFGRAIAQYLVSRQICEGPFRDWPQQPQQVQPASPSFQAAWPASNNLAVSTEWAHLENGKQVLPFLQMPPQHLSASRDQGGMSPLNSRLPQSPGGASKTTSSPTLSITPPASTSVFNLANHDGEAGDQVHLNGQHHHYTHGHHHPYVHGPPLHEREDDAESVLQMTVPNAAVAFLIGRGGSTVIEMEHKSGAKIRIAKPTGLGDAESGRVVMLRGSDRSVRNAQSMVQARIDAYNLTHDSVELLQCYSE